MNQPQIIKIDENNDSQFSGKYVKLIDVWNPKHEVSNRIIDHINAQSMHIGKTGTLLKNKSGGVDCIQFDDGSKTILFYGFTVEILD